MCSAQAFRTGVPRHAPCRTAALVGDRQRGCTESVLQADVLRHAHWKQRRRQLHSLEARSPSELDKAFEGAIVARAGALAILPDPVISTNLRRIVDFAAKSRLPSIYQSSKFADAGGLVTYGPDRADLFRRAAADAACPSCRVGVRARRGCPAVLSRRAGSPRRRRTPCAFPGRTLTPDVGTRAAWCRSSAGTRG